MPPQEPSANYPSQLCLWHSEKLQNTMDGISIWRIRISCLTLQRVGSNHLASAAATRFIAHETGSTRMEGGLKVNAGRVGRRRRSRRDDLIAIKGNCRKSDRPERERLNAPPLSTRPIVISRFSAGFGGALHLFLQSSKLPPPQYCARLYNTQPENYDLTYSPSLYKALNQVQSWSNQLTPVGKEGVRIRFRCKHSLSKVSCNLLLFALLRWARRQARPTHIHTAGLHTIFEKRFGLDVSQMMKLHDAKWSPNLKRKFATVFNLTVAAVSCSSPLLLRPSQVWTRSWLGLDIWHPNPNSDFHFRIPPLDFCSWVPCSHSPIIKELQISFLLLQP